MAYNFTSGDDTYHGSGIGETIKTLEGNDQVIVMDWQNSTADGGIGTADQFIIDPASTGGLVTVTDDTVSNFEVITGAKLRQNLLDFRHSTLSVFGGDQDDTITIFGGVANGKGGDDDISVYGGLAAVHGDAGNDTLRSLGVQGNNTFYGDYGDDRYYIRYNDIVIEHAGEGTDTVVVNFNYMLGANVENIEVVGANNLITGNDAANVIKVITADNGNSLHGGAGRDTISGHATIATSDLLYGDGGNDMLYGYGGADTLDGGVGNDRLDGGDGDDKLFGGDGFDTVSGGAGADRLFGNAGSDILDGGAGLNYIDGGAGSDTVSYATATAGVLVDLVATGFQDTHVSQDQLVSIENLVGSRFADQLYGDKNVNRLSGGVGNDQLHGGGGNDVLLGGNGADTLEGELGRDTMTGGLGSDVFLFESLAAFGGVTRTAADVIKDFSSAQHDHIDFKGIDASAKGAGDQAFAFIGKAAFGGHAGELRYETAGGNTYVSGDVNGDGAADFMLRLDGLHTLHAADFIL